ncbi:hypothetical protein CLV24_11970 [Pontibacter ummariensis]|uniref:Uncharacterized protein n=1 Tax=Pontibacter ummariensis TaxID=1610492 RepID=A0A239IZ36_9BACT|nr:hypothetical protein CLV24_11970 [Pontibacter ummariensis]SNS98468.1 hypothetical protein SAMN06296052_11970 [Pontibacter ummariensis]
MAIGKKDKKFKSALTGAASSLNLYGSTKSVSAIQERLKKVGSRVQGGRATDYNNINQDWRNIGSDIRSAITKTRHFANCD